MFIHDMPGLVDCVYLVMEGVLPEDNRNHFFIAVQYQRNTFKWNILHVDAVCRIQPVHLKRDNAAAVIPDELIEKCAPVVRLYVGYLYRHVRRIRRRYERIEFGLFAKEGNRGRAIFRTGHYGASGCMRRALRNLPNAPFKPDPAYHHPRSALVGWEAAGGPPNRQGSLLAGQRLLG